MATFQITITTNTSQNRAAVAATNKENERRAALDPPLGPLTEKEYVTEKVYDVLNSWVVQMGTAQANQASVKERWAISSEAQRAAAVNQLEPLPAE